MSNPNATPMKEQALWYSLVPLFFIAGPVGAEYELIHGPQASDPMAVHVYRLENGLTVYLSENHQEPRFYVETVVRAGSKHDPDESTGIAHYLEHMLKFGSDEIGTLDFQAEKVHLDSIGTLYERHFNETDSIRRKAIYQLIGEQSQLAATYAIPGEIDKAYSAMGGKGRNAHTSVEETVHKVDLPSNRLPHWARVESERFGALVFRLFQTELETVYEEKNRSMDNKDRLILQAVKKRLYKKHPYGQHTTLGSTEHLKSPSLRRMYEFYHTYYVPNNMAVIISGDIDTEETIRLIDREFSSWQTRQLPKPRRWKESKLRGREDVTVRFSGEEYVLLAFRTAPSTHKHTEALQVLDMILDNATAGLINLNLNQQQQVRRAGAWTTSHRNQNDYGAQYLWGVPKQDQSLEQVEQLLLDQLELIKNGEFEDWIIPAIVTYFKKTYKRRLESNAARVGLIRQSFLSFESWDRSRGKLERMGKLTRKDIVRAAKKYFGTDYVAGYRRDGELERPAIEKPDLAAIDIDRTRQSEFIGDLLEMPYDEIEPVYIIPGRDFKVKQVREGVKLYYAKNPLNDLFSFSISVDVGMLADKRLKVARDLMDKSGTPLFRAEELKQEWFRLGSDFSIGVSDHETTVTISGLDENFGASLRLMKEALQQPVTDDSTLAELKRIILVKREDAQKDHHTISHALYRFNRHGQMSPYHHILTNEQVLALTRQELHNLIRSLLTYEHTLSYVGSLPASELLAQLATDYLLPDAELTEPPPFQPLAIRKPARTEIYLFDKEIAQALVRVESGDEPYSESWRPATDLYNEYFYGGAAGIVYQELRQARGLAYRTWTQYFSGSRVGDPNLMAGFIGCQADKTPEALAALIDLIDNLPVSPERFGEAKLARLNQYRTSRLGFRQVLGAIRTWEHQGVPIDPRAWRFEQIEMAGIDKVLDFQIEHVANRPKLISIVGDKSKIDMEALARSGEITELRLDDIFGY